MLHLRYALVLAVALAMHGLPVRAADELVVHVTPASTLESARDAIRARRTSSTPVRVIVHGGRYPLRETFVLAAEDGGTPGAPVRYEAAEGETPILHGAVSLPTEGFARIEEQAVLARLANDEAREAVRALDLEVGPLDRVHARGFGRPILPAPAELFLGRDPLTLARWPNEGFTKTGKVLDKGSVPRHDEKPDRPARFCYEGIRPERWAGAKDAWLYGYWFYDWADESIPLAQVDVEKGEILLGGPHRYGVKEGMPFFAENLLEELDRPGEYMIDRETGTLYLWPLEGAPYVLSVLGEPMFDLRGASHVEIRGLTFETTRGDAIHVEGGTGVRIEDCGFHAIGARAVVIQGGTNHAIRGCVIRGTGEGGIHLEGGDRMRLEPSGHEVTDCDIADFSRRTSTYRPAVRLDGCGHRVAYNHMHHAPHAAVIFGGNDHVIEWNEFDHLLTRTGDGGAVYCGRDWTLCGTTIRHNHFHDLVGIGKWENGVYLDDQASGMTVTHNLFERCHLAMLIGGGRRNVISDNLLIDCSTALRFGARGLGWAKRMRGTLEERLEAVPYRDPPWSERFPWLLTLLGDEPMAPRHNVIERNVLVRSGEIGEHLSEHVIEHGTVEGNISTDAVPEGRIPLKAGRRSGR